MWRRVLLVLIVPVLVLAIACGGGDDETPPPTPTIAPTIAPLPTTAPTVAPSPSPTDGEVIIIEVRAGSDPYVYSPADFGLEAGKRYRFVITGDAEFHTFTANDLGVNVNILANTPPETVEFVVDQPGTYKYICIPHEFEGMVGTITVR